MLHRMKTTPCHFSPPHSKIKKLLKIAAVTPTSMKNFTRTGHKLNLYIFFNYLFFAKVLEHILLTIYPHHF